MKTAAYPRPGHYSSGGPRENDNVPQTGMSMRQWYKGMALSGLLAGDTSCFGEDVEKHVKMAAELADASIREDEQHELP
jgi:hypothetical protein